MHLSSTALHVYLRWSLSPRLTCQHISLMSRERMKPKFKLHSSEVRPRGAIHPLHVCTGTVGFISRYKEDEQSKNRRLTSLHAQMHSAHIMYLVLLGLTQRVLFLQSCHCGDPSLRCPPREGAGAGDSEERNRRELEGASLRTHSRGAQPDTQWHGRGSVSDTS